MKTLILCIDRDDDLGRKAGVKGPIIGREANLKAAVSLALVDPEDSDANAIFASLSLYDRLKKEGKDVVIATLTGSENVGMKSDEIIAKQLDIVIKELNPDDIIFVSDGSEDEYVLPIITSRRPIKHIRKVIVKQSKNIESTYYIIKRALEDKKLAKKILIPTALIFLAYALSSLIVLAMRLYNPKFSFVSPGTLALTVITLTLGLYFIDRVYSIGKRLKTLISSAKRAMVEAKITVISDTLAVLIILTGLDFAYNAALTSNDIIIQILLFLHTLVLWMVFAILVREGGKAFDIWVHRGEYTRTFWIALLSTIATGIIIYAALDYLLLILNAVGSASIVPITIMVISGIIVGIMAAILRREMRIEGEEKDDVERVEENLQSD